MTFKQFPYRSGRIFGYRYVFESAGDGIPMHEHTEQTVHNIIVVRGSVAVYGPRKVWSVTLHAGDVYDLSRPMEAHEVRALEPGTITLHLSRNGPTAYEEETPDSMLVAEDDRPVTIRA